ncbi:MAG TPA: GNAT family N-acetyltransferase [Stellaceae bacterium]|nr:GNAT family N-acetyltransferase [Stellaceae bacterium]
MAMTIRQARASDSADLRRAFIELQEAERTLHDSRLPGEAVAGAYLEWLAAQVRENGGAIFVAHEDGIFRGFIAGWIVADDHLIETPDSNRFGLISDLCVLEAARGRGIAQQLLAAAERQLAQHGVTRLRIGALAANAAARAAYLKYGFSPYEIVFEKRVAGG